MIEANPSLPHSDSRTHWFVYLVCDGCKARRQMGFYVAETEHRAKLLATLLDTSHCTSRKSDGTIGQYCFTCRPPIRPPSPIVLTCGPSQ